MTSRNLSNLLNLGPATSRLLAEVGIRDEADLRDVGAVEAWRRLKFRFPRRINAVALYALEGALRGCHWNALPAEVGAQLRDIARAYGRRA